MDWTAWVCEVWVVFLPWIHCVLEIICCNSVPSFHPSNFCTLWSIKSILKSFSLTDRMQWLYPNCGLLFLFVREERIARFRWFYSLSGIRKILDFFFFAEVYFYSILCHTKFFLSKLWCALFSCLSRFCMPAWTILFWGYSQWAWSRL